jgi:hypothetical protein
MNELEERDTEKGRLTRRPKGVWVSVTSRPAKRVGQKQPYSDQNRQGNRA